MSGTALATAGGGERVVQSIGALRREMRLSEMLQHGDHQHLTRGCAQAGRAGPRWGGAGRAEMHHIYCSLPSHRYNQPRIQGGVVSCEVGNLTYHIALIGEAPTVAIPISSCNAGNGLDELGVGDGSILLCGR